MLNRNAEININNIKIVVNVVHYVEGRNYFYCSMLISLIVTTVFIFLKSELYLNMISLLTTTVRVSFDS